MKLRVGGSAVANRLTGFGMDEMYQRTDAASTAASLSARRAFREPRTRIVSSTRAAVTATPVPSSNATAELKPSVSKTSRQHRARYYSPEFQRFVSQDPLGFGGGDVNLYGYVGNSPMNGNDPTGLFAGMIMLGGLMGGLFNGAGTLAWQLIRQRNGGEPVNGADVFMSAMVGIPFGMLAMFFSFGPAMPLLGGILGAMSNLTQLIAMAPLHEAPDARHLIADLILAITTGFVAGAIGSAFPLPALGLGTFLLNTLTALISQVDISSLESLSGRPHYPR